MIKQAQMTHTMQWMDEVGFEVAVDEVDLHIVDLLHCARQRALRVLAAKRGHDYYKEWSKGNTSMDLDEDEMVLLGALETMWIDGMVNGLRTHANEQQNQDTEGAG